VSILVINAGSSSLKFGLFDQSASLTLASGLIDWTANQKQAELVVRPREAPEIRSRVDVSDHRAAALHAIRFIGEGKITPEQGNITVVGHRVVHGGTIFRDSVRIDERVKSAISRLVELAPLHNPPALEALEAAEAALPDVPQVAVFDTAFFAHLPPRVFVYPLPYEWYTAWGVRRFGFHGISHAYCAGRAAEVLGRAPAALRLVTCHLGNGCSATAVQGGQALATTMGFTPMEGLMMGSRSGSVDPGILLYVQRQRGLTAEQLDQALNHKSGLLGVSGVSSDFRQVEAAAGQGNEQARLALEIYAARVRAAVGALAVTLGGIDCLVFTAGVGENSASLRAAVCSGLECLGLQLDADKNRSCRPDGDVAGSQSQGRILIIHTQEELLIAREARRIEIGKASN
jgi:acetate kinase